MQAAKKQEDAVYVGIEDPVSVRRDLLEASKSMVHILKGQNSLRSLRAEKHKLIEGLRTKVSEINSIVADVRGMLPHTEKINLSQEEKPKKAVKPTVAAAAKKKMLQPKPKLQPPVEHHIDKFERELQDIEKKLQSL